MKFIEIFLNAIYPPKCGVCNKICNKYICSNCERKIEKIKKVRINNVKNKYFEEQIYMFEYKGIIREKIIDYKFNNKAYLCEFFVKIILNSKKICGILKKYDIIIPVPIHRKRWKERGYNQTELIADKIGKALNIKVEKDILIKQKNTVAQSTLTKDARMKNIIDTYKISNNEIIVCKNILIIDDVYTTGSTANECSRILKLAQAQKIGVLTIAKD